MLLSFSKTSFYNYVNLKVLDISNIDLPRQVRYKKEKTKREEHLKLDKSELTEPIKIFYHTSKYTQAVILLK